VPLTAAERNASEKVVAIFGPTASGKTAVAEALADRLATEVVSADAMQVYRGLPLLTNQPSRPTQLVAMWALSHESSVGEYQRLAHAAIDDLVTTRGSAVVAGGTGLYLRAALAELNLPPAGDPTVRARWEAEYDRDPAGAYATLAQRDPAAASALHANDRRRVVRALELTDIGMSLTPESDRLWDATTRHPTVIVGLDLPANDLEERIVARTAAMFNAGVIDEVAAALAQPLSRTAAKALGLDEIASLPPAAAQERVIVRTRQYAAYQRKWMRRIPRLVGVDARRPADEVASEILEMARARQ
jgi:tRNA dimethylallyltransferase